MIVLLAIIVILHLLPLLIVVALVLLVVWLPFSDAVHRELLRIRFALFLSSVLAATNRLLLTLLSRYADLNRCGLI